jgi:hypothetical protein
LAGNATVTTNNAFGAINTDIWIQSINTGSDLQFDDNQVKRGISWRPIRRSEMYVEFTAIWSLQNYNLMDQFQEAIRAHHVLISQGDDTPMTLNYTGAYNGNSVVSATVPNDDNNTWPYQPVNLIYYGWIESAKKQFVRFDDIFVRYYRMNILLPSYFTQIVESDPNGGLVSPNNIAFYGTSWYNVNVTDSLSSLTPLQTTIQQVPQSQDQLAIHSQRRL